MIAQSSSARSHEAIVLVTNAYPSDEDLYRYGFVHTRVKAYLKAGLKLDVYCVDLRRDSEATYVFDGVTVVTGPPADFQSWVSVRGRATYLVHFPVKYMLEPLRQLRPEPRVIMWFHGYEIEAWHRRWFNFLDDDTTTAASLIHLRQHSTEALAYLRDFLKDRPLAQCVTVSDWFRHFVVEPDLGLMPRHFSVIPNFVDPGLFRFENKAPDHSRKVLVVRPFTSRKYATESVIQTIVEVVRRTGASEFQFSVFGEGPLFAEAEASLRGLPNVALHRRFLTRAEVAEQHRLHGIYLNPTVWDSHGVSTSEAMSSGLVPVTTDVCAVPEFVTDDVSGILAPPHDIDALAEGIIELGRDQARHRRLSRRAAEDTARQCGWDATIARELALIDGTGSTDTVTAPRSDVDWMARYRFLEAQFEAALMEAKKSMAPDHP
ncbi:glycosyltransferase family 4 protein [Knoellia subterranea]|uniref:Uncharacterized protein n=1 Tax=Knoellia subterranea KCTC 19937 TaxID=1385521 RepID=A0A0A0JFY9_9MICO|nr:glycosyltransferase family 4 protein [Knoellia subterranea]KGN35694.1 hypothetical protein N803_06385 [Knoellia subterranea KCTC 19937]